jgi:hypothetical protein
MSSTAIGRLNRFGPYSVTVPFQAVIFGFYGQQFLPFGFVAILAGALLGVLWALLLGVIAERAARHEGWRTGLANGPLCLGIVATGLMTGGGYMYGAMMTGALAESSLTSAVLSALMRPAVPFYIALNSSMELVIVSLIVCWNWEATPRRRALILVAVAAYLVLRIWTYLVFAETRLAISQRPLTEADVTWFKETLGTDFRLVLLAVTNVSFILAAFLAACPEAARAARGRKPGAWLRSPTES